MISRRGQGISINTVIIIALAVMTLVLVAFFLFGGFSKSAEQIVSTADSAAEQAQGDEATGEGGLGSELDKTIEKIKGEESES